MCNFNSITTNQAAIVALFYIGDLQPVPGSSHSLTSIGGSSSRSTPAKCRELLPEGSQRLQQSAFQVVQFV